MQKIDKFLIIKAVVDLLEEYPEMRICQLMSNISGGCGTDFFYITDEKFVQLAKDFVDKKYAKTSVATVEVQKPVSEKIADILKIKPQYYFTYKYYGENSRLMDDYEEATIECSRLNGSPIAKVFPNFETNSTNLVKLMDLMLKNAHFQYDGPKQTTEKIYRYLKARRDSNEVVYLQSQVGTVRWDMSEYRQTSCDVECCDGEANAETAETES